MKILYIIIFIILAASLLLLTANTGYYKLQEQSIEYSGVVAWLLSDKPVPVFTDRMAETRFPDKPAATFYSERQDIIGVMQHDQNQISVTWFDVAGQQIGSFEEPWLTDLPLPRFSLIDEGRKLLAVDINSRVRLIGPEGLVKSEFRLLPEIPFNTENAVFYRYLARSRRLAFGFRHILPDNAMNSIFLISDLEGTELVRTEFQNWQIDAVNASPEADIFCLALHKVDIQTDEFYFRTVLLDHQGKFIADLPYQHQSAVFSPEGKLLVFYHNDNAHLYDMSNARILQEFFPAENRIFMRTVFLPDNDFVLQTGSVYRDFYGWAYRDIMLSTHDAAGMRLDQLDLAGHTVYRPALWIDQKTNQLGIGFSDGWQIYQITK